MSSRRDLAALAPFFAAAVLFGVMSVAVRLAAQEVAPLQIAFFRFSGSLLVLLATSGGRDLRPQPGNLGRVLLRGLIGATAISLFFVGIAGAGAGLASLLQSTYPVFAAVIASTVLGERFGVRLVAALLLNLCGALFVFGSELRLGAGAEVGMLAALAAAVLSGAAIVTARHLRHTENATLITTYFMAVGAIVTAPALLAGVPPLGGAAVAALLVVVLTSVAAQWLLHHGLGFVAAAHASLVAATGVVTAAALEALWFGEAIHAGTLAGGALMIAAIGLASGSAAAPAAPATSMEPAAALPSQPAVAPGSQARRATLSAGACGSREG